MTPELVPSAVPHSRERWLVAALAVVVAGGLFWPMPLHLTDALVTSPTGEGPEHVWRWWVGAQVGRPWGGDFGGLNHPEGLSVHVIDPLNGLMARALGWWWGGPAAGHAVVQVAGIVVSALAGHLLADETGADRAGRILGAAAGMAIPTVVGAGIDGITEGLGLGWVGLQLGYLLRLVRTRCARDVVMSGLTLGAAAWSGPYTLVFSAMIDVVVVVAVARRTWLPLLSSAFGAVLATPIIWSAFTLVDQAPGGAGRSAMERPPVVDAWRGAWREGADLVDLFVPSWITGECASAPTTGYLGLFWLLVVGWGAVRALKMERFGTVLPWLLGAVVFAVLALGPFVVVGGEVATLGSAELWAPAAFLESVPILGRLSRWYRAAAVAVLLSIPVAGHVVRGRSSLLAAILGILVMMDARVGSPAPFPAPVVSIDTTDARGWSGAVAELPPVHPLGQQGVVADRNLLFQTQHGHASSGTIEARSGAASHHAGILVLERVLRLEPADSDALVESARRQLVADGFRTLLLYSDLLPEGAVPALSDRLGPGEEVSTGIWMVRLDAVTE